MLKSYKYYFQCPRCEGVAFLLNHKPSPGDICKEGSSAYYPTSQSAPLNGTPVTCDKCNEELEVKEMTIERIKDL